MLKTLEKLIPDDKDLPKRASVMLMREEFRTSAIYDRLPYEFHTEKQSYGTGEYIPLRQRAPSVRYGLPMVIVNDSTALLFSEGHFPKIQCTIGRKKERDDKDEQLDAMFLALVKETELRAVMLDGAEKGSIGSVCYWMKVIDDRVFFEALSTIYLTPTWSKKNPRRLAKVQERYKVKGRDLRDRDYTEIKDEDLDREFWFRREWTETQEVWYKPWPVRPKERERGYPKPNTIDTELTVDHDLGFVPMVWVKNLPGGDKIDGRPTVVTQALHNSIEIDYQLSQQGRGLKYASDPTLILKETGMNMGDGGEPIIRSAGNAIRLGPNDDAHLLELSGSASATVEAYVRHVRELSLELCGGNRTSPEKLAAAQSGRAMELMNQGLIWLADKLRISYGEGALLSLLKMVLAVNEKFDLLIGEERYTAGTLKAKTVQITLKWPPWYPPTASDLTNKATAIKTAREAGVMSRETGIDAMSHDFDVEDTEAEKKAIDDEGKEKQAQEMALAVATPPKSPVKEAA